MALLYGPCRIGSFMQEVRGRSCEASSLQCTSYKQVELEGKERKKKPRLPKDSFQSFKID